VNLADVRNFRFLVQRAAFQGERIPLAIAGKPIAALVPIEDFHQLTKPKAKPKRKIRRRRN
jgi:antitoxin (DNA-binding transcriptional repressor) of toxin-antitoxin stability system